MGVLDYLPCCGRRRRDEKDPGVGTHPIHPSPYFLHSIYSSPIPVSLEHTSLTNYPIRPTNLQLSSQHPAKAPSYPTTERRGQLQVVGRGMGLFQNRRMGVCQASNGRGLKRLEGR